MARSKRAAKLKQAKLKQQGNLSPTQLMRQASRWPVDKCVIGGNWQGYDNLLQLVLSRCRVGPTGISQYAMSVILLDPGCLGVKNAFGTLGGKARRDEVFQRISSMATTEDIDPSVGLMIMQQVIAYARDLGFEPHPDLAEALPLWDGIEPAPVDDRLWLGGLDGKPYYVSGPDDDVDLILAKLEARFGPGGFQKRILM